MCIRDSYYALSVIDLPEILAGESDERLLVPNAHLVDLFFGGFEFRALEFGIDLLRDRRGHLYRGGRVLLPWLPEG